MLATGGVILTTAGSLLISRSLELVKPIEFTHMKIGTGDISSIAQARKLNDLVASYKNINMSTLVRSGDLVRVRGSFTNDEITETVRIKEVGVFAKIGTEQPILFGYVNDGEGELIPPGTSGVIARTRDLYIGVTGEAEVAITINKSLVYATIEDLEEGLNRKEDKYIKRSGWNLDKTDLTENDSNKVFTPKGALNLFNTLTTNFTNGINAAKEVLRLDIAKKLNKGAYLGDAQDLKNDIDERVPYYSSTKIVGIHYNPNVGLHWYPDVSTACKFWDSHNFNPDEKLDRGGVTGTALELKNWLVTNYTTLMNNIKSVLDNDIAARLPHGGYNRTAQDLKNDIDTKVSKNGDTMTGQLKINSYTPGQSGDRSIGFITTDYTGTQNEWLLGLQDYSSGKIAEVFGSTFADYSLRFAGRHRIYHEGFKPNADNVGALKREVLFSAAVPKTFNGACQVQSVSPDFAGVGGGSQMFMLQMTTDENSDAGAYVGQIAWGYDPTNPKIAIRCKNPFLNGGWYELLKSEQVLGPQGQISGHVFMNQQYDGQAYLHAYPLNHEGTPVSFNLRTGRAGDMRAFEFGANGELTLPNRCLSYSTNLMYSHITGMQLHSNERQIGFVSSQGHWGLRHGDDGISRTPHSLMFDSGDRVYGEYGSIGFLDSAGNWAFRVAPGSGEVTAKGIITSQGAEVLTFANVNRYCPHRVGDTIESTSAEHPASTWLGTQWERYGNGMVVVGVSEGEGEFASVGQTGGAKYVSLTAAQNGPHEHTLTSVTGGNGWYGQGGNLGGFGGITTSSSGSGEAHNNLQPYVALYRWRRVA